MDQKNHKQDTPDDINDDTVDTEEAEFLFKMGGIKLNSFKNDAFPGYVYSAIAVQFFHPIHLRLNHTK